MADINDLEALISERLVGRKSIGKKILFDLKEEGNLLIDGVAEQPTVSRVDDGAETDATITIAADDLAGLLDGSLNGQSLMMTGRAKMKGNPMVAMKLGELLL